MIKTGNQLWGGTLDRCMTSGEKPVSTSAVSSMSSANWLVGAEVSDMKATA